MRIITNYYFDKKMLLDNKIMYQLVVENKKEYYNMIYKLKSQIIEKEEGDFRLSCDNEYIDLFKKAELIIDIFNISNDDRKIQSNLIKYYENELNNTELKIDYYELVTIINQFMLKLKNNIDIKIDYTDELNLKDFLKTVKIKPSIKDDNPIDLLIDYIKYSSELAGIDIIFICNLSSYLEEKEVDDLIKELQLNEINLIMIENKKIDYKHKDVETIIIDKDLCEIHQ
ncbi:type II-A CRISPR-associated protein Csn2 [Hujiaoplasma nucleasis]|uniref:Type II-A CRISPR-associated protein Csn2 n=1 Tax=Hujiaoplasma nucleasis TaxID=2725268 RepID=A0A7L6N549_9MOLU|nr:type II-A CRISPR-associated protein Csn2 [Hujiaoplasma nucleasis]QLY40368.1 type II-A CRISPR-associated protein Csn2 [Hujiaoplasma nucleasis]